MEDKFDVMVRNLNELREFLNLAPTLFAPDDKIRRHKLPNSEVISCVKWDDEFFISGTDILRCIMFRFSAFGRRIMNRAKFEEFVFSDLRSLKTNVRVRLEESKSELLEFLHKNGCIRTKKKQRVFYWDAVPHDQLFLDSLERELRRAVVDDASNERHRITVAVAEPALSMKNDPMLKVVHQIPKILNETSPAHLPIMCAIFGVKPLAQQSPNERSASFKDQYARSNSDPSMPAYPVASASIQMADQRDAFHRPTGPPLAASQLPANQDAANHMRTGPGPGPLPPRDLPRAEQLANYLPPNSIVNHNTEPHANSGETQPRPGSSLGTGTGISIASLSKPMSNSVTRPDSPGQYLKHARLPPPQMRLARQNFRLPSIHDALPAHARLDFAEQPPDQLPPPAPERNGGVETNVSTKVEGSPREISTAKRRRRNSNPLKIIDWSPKSASKKAE